MKLYRFLLIHCIVWCSSIIYAGPFAYVANSTTDTITPVDLSNNTVLASINTLATYPSQFAITPNNKTLYVLNSTTFNACTVTPIDIKTNSAGQPITVGNVSYDLAITPDGKTVYVTNSASSTITPIDTATNTAGTPINLSGAPYGIAITPNGRTAYVTNIVTNAITPIDIATNTPGTDISGGLTPVAIAITPDSKAAYVANMGDSTISIIDITTNKVSATLDVNAVPVDIIITTDGSKAYVANANAATITPIDIMHNKIESVISLGTAYPVGIALSPDNRTLYATNLLANSVIPIDIATSTVGAPITGFISPRGIIVTPSTLPPSNFIGTLKKNVYTGEITLTATWHASPTIDVVLYRVYKEGNVVDEILAGFPLTMSVCVLSNEDAQDYEIAALSANNLESAHVPITIYPY